MKLKLISAAILSASAFLASAAGAAVVPGDTFNIAVVGFNTDDSTGVFLVAPITATFGLGAQTFTGYALNRQVVTVTTLQTIGATTTTDLITLSVPTNFVPAGTTTSSGAVVNDIELDLGAYNAGTNTLDFLTPIGSPSYAGSINYGMSSTLTLTPGPTLSNGNKSLAAYEAVNTTATAGLSQFAIKAFNFSITYATPAAVPEPASWALMIAGFGAVGFAMRRSVRRSDARFDTRIKRIAAGEIA